MNTFKFKLYVKGDTVYFQVLEQPECTREIQPYTAKNGMRIAAAFTPLITHGTVYLRGTAIRRDNEDTCYKCDSVPAAHRYFADVLEALTEWWDQVELPAKQSIAVEADDEFTFTFTKE